MKTKQLLSTIAMLFMVLISGCANDDFNEIVGVCPVVTTTNPINGAIGVPLNQIITATFNEAMNPATIQTSFTVTGGSAVSGVISYSGNTATFTPNGVLSPNTIYTAKITTSAKDVDGNALQTDYVWTFTTGILPFVQSTDPVNNAINVPLNKIISATFNMPMNPLTINGLTYTVKEGASIVGIGGLISNSNAGKTFSFTPTLPLIANKVYTVTITTGARNVSGTAMANDYVWKFTTFNLVNSNPPPVVTTTGLGFGVFGGNAGITNQGLLTVVNGSIGTTAASTLVTGFLDGTSGDGYTITPLNNGLVTNGIYTDAPAPGNANKAATALAGLNAARALYLSISPAQMPNLGVAPFVNPGAGELGGLSLAPGVYTASSSFKITNGNLTLNAQGDPNAKWYFQAPSTLTVGDSAPSSVVFLNGVGNPNNVYWYVGTAAVINYAGGGVMVGNIIANSGVTLSSPANSTNPLLTVLNGRAISLVASVTMVNTIVNVPTN
ncbi:Ig-like domain-containing protein [Flavobacterium cellulosilyticum]|uniref:DUF3494 domain-containing protein n=1 Tax=Flavobacterium cellulosilyticum TaxID=2541731 RepID=A0A4R5CIP9_9FLAO|nr:Ig-like domain-containing protein [Flavobacterium cellulosilyticum]TDD98430.1 DUF3494 domain-containing protein [Flavobacterium cellulosilyticum]